MVRIRVVPPATDVTAPRRGPDSSGIRRPDIALSTFVGRNTELAALHELLGRVRLLTLVGPGGVGKTRLALKLASTFDRGSTSIAQLGALREPSLVDRAILDAVGGPVRPDRPPLEVVGENLGQRSALLVLDNCEHLLEPAASAAVALLGSCSSLRIIATSRAPLSVAGETTWPVPPLAVDPAGDAVRLFIDRAREVRPAFDAGDAELDAVASICSGLDGLPLAIELAAARTRTLGIGQIAAGLSDRFQLLTGHVRGSPARQRTLRASLDWSYDLLSDIERLLFARLAVFAGGCALEAAQAVCCDDSLPRESLVDVLTGLIEKSLVSARESRGVARYEMLETVREYARERLEHSTEQGLIRDRHLAWFVAFAEQANSDYIAMTRDGREQLDHEMANLRAALSHAIDSDPEAGLRICAALVWHWRERGMYLEGIETLDRAIDSAPEVTGRPRARALGALAMLTGYAGDIIRSAQLDEQVVELGREIADPYAVGFGLTGQGLLTSFLDPAMGRPVLERAADAARQSGHRVLEGDALMWLVVGAAFQDDESALDGHIEQALRIAEPLQHRNALAWCSWARGNQALAKGMPDAARGYAQQILEAPDDVEEPVTRAVALRQLAIASAMTGQAVTIRYLVGSERERFRSSGAFAAEIETELAGIELELALGNATAARARASALLAPDVLLAFNQRWQAHHLLARAALDESDTAVAREHADKVREHARGNHRAAALAQLIDSRAELLSGDDERAEALAHQALATCIEHGWDAATIDALEQLAAIAARQGNPEYAARLMSAVRSARRARGLVRHPPDRTFWKPLEASVLGDAQTTAIEAGSKLALEDAVTYVRRGRGSRARPLSGWGSLTPTEIEVAELIAAGLNNVQIAERLFISRSTVKYHLANIYAKLNIAGRTGLAAIVAARKAGA